MNTFNNAIIKEITMTRGDSMAFNFQLQGLKGAVPEDIVFTCKEHYEDSSGYFTQSLTGGGITQVGYIEETDTTTFCCRVRPDQTVNLDLARYYYGLDLYINDDVITLMKGRLTLEYNVTD